MTLPQLSKITAMRRRAESQAMAQLTAELIRADEKLRAIQLQISHASQETDPARAVLGQTGAWLATLTRRRQETLMEIAQLRATQETRKQGLARAVGEDLAIHALRTRARQQEKAKKNRAQDALFLDLMILSRAGCSGSGAGPYIAGPTETR